MKVKSLSRVRLFAIQWTVAHHAPLFMGFSRQEHWSGLPFSSPEDLPDPEIEPSLPHCKQDALLSESPGHPHFQCLAQLINGVVCLWAEYKFLMIICLFMPVHKGLHSSQEIAAF